ncbi:hypothetical protein [Hespellia stercorisuis]|uniref:Uncharacterized protein n=1 Tax=Hespellia stercorisuis DSM 15480 TaxID=1121950 RepID=A0A1M6RMF3_9FIRM|nr:hypothetical protein [Hespellia stercorisuis]SHK33635.1 hypothetical protein SAMN02745243_02734 [Hespellia stercorisuis DSM 15480]
MKNVKDQVYAALLDVNENVSDQYPRDWAHLPAQQYIEDENKVHEHTGEGETKSYVRYRIDIWDNASTSNTALKTDEAMSRIGLVRTSCKDVPDPSGLKHKVMIYEGIIDMGSDEVFWTD